MSENNKRKRKILIADDSDLNCDMLTEILGDNYDYLLAGDGEETLKVLSEDADIDMLLLDMNMPKISGMQVLKAMRERNWLDEIPVVIISAENDDNFIKNAYYLGATDYIVRPYNAFLVRHRVENTLMMYSQKKQLVRMVESQIFRREKINDMLIKIFSHVVEIGNSESGSHTQNVQTITNMLLKRLTEKTDKYNLSEEDISMISSVSSLHDIGKIMIPEKILNKRGKLTEEEWEIMKKHTVNGDEFLTNIPIDQSELLMKTAHEICRHHHERYDGNGYPDGLVGDEIPICAQVVSVADVYDALTSERCYKRAYPHEKAVQMILGGECGVFNPLLLECFGEIADELFINLKMNNGEYHSQKNAQTLTGEALENMDLSVGERYESLIEEEKVKKGFFADRCRGIQFEYDAVLRNIVYIRYYNENGEKILLQSGVTELLSEEDRETLYEKLKTTTRQNPTTEMTVLVPVNGNLRWHNLRVRTVWTGKKGSYTSIVGQFTDIHDRVIQKSAPFILNDKTIKGETLLAMCDIFDFVRVVDPCSCEEMKVDKDGNMSRTGEKCHKIWNRSEPCKDCSSKKAMENKNWMSKLEIKDGLLYSVLSRYMTAKDKDYALEVAFCIEDSLEKAHSEIGFLPDSITLKNYYRDTLTKAYSRAYLESFKPNIENAKGIAIADIDEFKSINDTYGHIVGDTVLKHIAKIIRHSMRKGDVIIRYGGDEFLIVFNEIEEADFFEKLQSIKEAVAKSEFSDYPNIKHEISIGGAYGVKPFEKAIDTADKAMYKDKFRNKIREKKE